MQLLYNESSLAENAFDETAEKTLVQTKKADHPVRMCNKKFEWDRSREGFDDVSSKYKMSKLSYKERKDVSNKLGMSASQIGKNITVSLFTLLFKMNN